MIARKFWLILLSLAGGLLLAIAWQDAIQTQASQLGLSPALSDGWRNLGLYGARSTGQHGNYVIDPQDEVVYLCALPNAVYGVYKTADGAATWQPLTSTVTGCRMLALDLASPFLYRANAYDVHVTRSSDGGLTWQDVFTGPVSSRPYAIALDPGNADKIIVGVRTQADGGKIYFTTDGGDNWQPAQFTLDGSAYIDSLDCLVNALAIDPTDTSRVFAAVGRFATGAAHRGIYRSEDGGQTFTRLLEDTANQGIDVNVNARGTVFALNNYAVWRSRDHGQNWEDVKSNIGGHSIHFHPVLTDTLWIFNYRSDDEGDTWSEPNMTYPPEVHPLDTNIMYGPSTYGAQKSIDGGYTWFPVNQGLTEVSVYRIVADPGNLDRFFFISAGAVGFTADNGQTWHYPVLEEDYLDIAIAPDDPNVVLAAFWGCEIWKSTDGGLSWPEDQRYEFDDGSLSCNNSRPNRLVFDRQNPSIVYLAEDTDGPPNGPWGGVFKSLDQGETWSPTSLTDTPVKTLLQTSSGYHLLAGVLNTYLAPILGGVYRSTDGGGTWTRSGLVGTPVLELEESPLQPGVIYAGADSGGLYKSLDNGLTWLQKLPVPLSYRDVTDIEVDSQNPNYVYALVLKDIYLSTDAGETWALFDGYVLGEATPRALFIRPGIPSPATSSLLPDLYTLHSTIYMGNDQGLYAQDVPAGELNWTFLPLVRR